MDDANPAELRPFTLPGPCEWEAPMCESHAWQWAKGQPRNKANLLAYLESVGFVVGRDKLSERDYEFLNLTFNHYQCTAPHFPGPIAFSEALQRVPDGKPGFYVQGKPGRYSLAPGLNAALVEAGWIYDVQPETTYFHVVNGILWARYQQIIGSRPIVEVYE